MTEFGFTWNPVFTNGKKGVNLICGSCKVGADGAPVAKGSTDRQPQLRLYIDLNQKA